MGYFGLWLIPILSESMSGPGDMFYLIGLGRSLPNFLLVFGSRPLAEPSSSKPDLAVRISLSSGASFKP